MKSLTHLCVEVGKQSAAGLFVSLVVLAGQLFALEVSPKNPVPLYSQVHIALDEGERCWILKQDFTPVEVVEKKSGGLCFTGPPGRYVVLGFSNTGQSQAVVQIGGNSPTPVPPGPDNPPGPTPDRFGLTKISAASRSKIGEAGRGHMGAIAANFAATASAAKAGTFKDTKAAVASVQAANKVVLVDQSQAWNAWRAWSNDVGFALDALKNGGRLTTIDDYADAFNEISAGLMQAGRW